MNMERVLQTFLVFLSILASIVSEHGTHNEVRPPCDHNNGGCSSTCFVSTNEQGYSCACPPGIPLLSDKKTCAHEGHAFLLVVDWRNILKISLDDSNYTVEKLQVNRISYVLDVDFDPLEGKIYWIEYNSNVIRRAYLNGSGQQYVVSSDLSEPRGIAIDSIARKLYWTDLWKRRIEMSDLNGTNRKVIMNDETVRPDAIVVDTRSKRIYWTNFTKQRIESSSLDGTNRSVVIDLNEGRLLLSLALDDERRIIYWAYFHMGKIEMAKLDGSDRRVLISNDKSDIRGLTVLGDYIYWTDHRTKVIERAHKKTGGNRQVIADNLYDPWRLKSIILRNIREQTCDSLVNPQHGYIKGLTNNSVNSVATFACHPGYRLVGEEKVTCLWIDNKLQWSNPTPECVKEKCKGLTFDSYNINYDPEPEIDFGTEVEYPDGTRATVTCEDGFEIFPFHSIIMNAATTVCVNGQWKPDIINCTAVRPPCDHKNGGCSSTCLVSNNEQGYSCSCPPGIPLLSDKKTCANEGHAFLLVANATNILKISLDDSNYTVEELQLDGIDWIKDVDFDPLEGKIYWTELHSRVIRRAYLNGSGQQDIVSSDLAVPRGIAIDSIARKLYWTNYDHIEMSDLNGTNRKVIMRDETARPWAIVVHTRSKRIYWTDYRKHRIESSSLDGTNRSVVIELNGGRPTSLALDEEERIIYWGYLLMEKIEMANIDGSNRRVLISNDISSIPGLSLLGDYIYWTDRGKNVIERVDKKTGDNRQVIADNLYNPHGLKSIILRNIKGESGANIIHESEMEDILYLFVCLFVSLFHHLV